VLVLGAVAIAAVVFVFGLLVGAGAAGRPAAAVCPREMVPNSPILWTACGHVFPDSPTHGPSLRQAPLGGWVWCIAALHHRHERCHKGAAINAYSVSTGDLKPLNFTWAARWRLALLAALAWAIGGAFDGHGLRALIAVPVLVGAWVCATLVLDRLGSDAPRRVVE
jgi:hypothetical protein